MRNPLLGIGTVLLVVLVSCDKTDVIGIRLTIKPDFSGTIVVSSLFLPEEPSDLEASSPEIDWTVRAHIVASGGTFDQLSNVKIKDIAFSAGKSSDGLSYARISLPRGAESSWPRAFVPAPDQEKPEIAKILDPTGEMKDIAKYIKLQIDLPEPPISHGSSPAPGLKEEVEGKRATLLLPIQSALQSGEALVWHLTW